MQQEVVAVTSRVELSVTIVWINMLEGDTEAAAIHAAHRVSAPDVQHFYDPHHQLGRTIAQSLGSPGEIAWDIYLFYPAGTQWGDMPPRPTAWMHQMGARWADRGHQHCDEQLVEKLRSVISTLQNERSDKGGVEQG